LRSETVTLFSHGFALSLFVKPDWPENTGVKNVRELPSNVCQLFRQPARQHRQYRDPHDVITGQIVWESTWQHRWHS